MHAAAITGLLAVPQRGCSFETTKRTCRPSQHTTAGQAPGMPRVRHSGQQQSFNTVTCTEKKSGIGSQSPWHLQATRRSHLAFQRHRHTRWACTATTAGASPAEVTVSHAPMRHLYQWAASNGGSVQLCQYHLISYASTLVTSCLEAHYFCRCSPVDRWQQPSSIFRG
jgi:hypothetical protein